MRSKNSVIKGSICDHVFNKRVTLARKIQSTTFDAAVFSFIYKSADTWEHLTTANLSCYVYIYENMLSQWHFNLPVHTFKNAVTARLHFLAPDVLTSCCYFFPSSAVGLDPNYEKHM